MGKEPCLAEPISIYYGSGCCIVHSLSFVIKTARLLYCLCLSGTLALVATSICEHAVVFLRLLRASSPERSHTHERGERSHPHHRQEQ